MKATSKRTDYIKGEASALMSDAKSLKELGTKAIGEVEAITEDMFNELKSQAAKYASQAVTAIRKNPLLAAAAVITIGLVIARAMRKPSEETSQKLSH